MISARQIVSYLNQAMPDAEVVVTDKAKQRAQVLTFWAKHGLEATKEAFKTKQDPFKTKQDPKKCNMWWPNTTR